VWLVGGASLCQVLLFPTSTPEAPAAVASAAPAEAKPPKDTGAVPDDIAKRIQRVSDTEFHVDRAVVDKYSRVGTDAVVGDGELLTRPEFAWLDGLTLVGKDVEVPDGARIGRQAVLGVGAGPADFTDNRVAAGLRVPDRLAHVGLV